MKLRYKPHTPRLKKVDLYIGRLLRDELPKGLKFHIADHALHPTNGGVASANRIAISENISEHDKELLITVPLGFLERVCSATKLRKKIRDLKWMESSQKDGEKCSKLSSINIYL